MNIRKASEYPKGKISGSKYVYLNYLKGTTFAWLSSPYNYLSAAKKDPRLIELTPWRWESSQLSWGHQLPWYKLPTQMIDGLLVGEYIKLFYKKKYPNIKSVDIDEVETNWNKKHILTEELLKKNSSIILFEPSFLIERHDFKFRIKGDILIKINNKIKYVEAKAITNPQIYHVLDLKYQREFLRYLNFDVENWDFYLGTLNFNYINKKGIIEEIDKLFIEWKHFFTSSLPKDIKNDEFLNLNNMDIQSNIKDAINFDPIINIKKNQNHSDIKLKTPNHDKKVLELTLNNYALNLFNNFENLLDILIYSQLPSEIPNEKISENFNKFLDSDYTPWILSINNVKKDSIFELAGDSGFNFKTKVNLWNSKIQYIKDIEDRKLILPKKIQDYENVSDTDLIRMFPKESKRLLQKMYLNQKEAFIMKKELSNWLKDTFKLKDKKSIIMYDFETCSMAISKVKLTSPYEQIPFQYSIHIIEDVDDFDWKTNKNVIHYEYLAKTKNFYLEFWNSFLEVIKKHKNNIFVSYNMSFEKMIMKNALNKENFFSSEQKKDIQNIIDNTVDLMTPFSNKWYYHNEFKGSYSIKKVATHFAKEINYSDLDEIVQKGDQSALQAKIWLHNLYDKFDFKGNLIIDKFFSDEAFKSENRWKEIRKSMLEYCKYDTLSMVAILQELLKLKYNEN